MHIFAYWMRVDTDLKTIQTPHRLFQVSEQIKPLLPIGQAAEFKFESMFKPLPVIWQSPQKAVWEDNRRFWLQNQWPSSWGSAPAMLGQVWRASTNTGCFLVGCSCCWLAWGKHATTLVILTQLESRKGFNDYKLQAATSDFFFMWNAIFNGIGEKLLLTKAAPIASLNLSISHWSVWHRNKSACSELNPVQSSRSKWTTCPKKGVCSDWNWTAQWLQMAAHKAWRLKQSFTVLLTNSPLLNLEDLS